MSKKKVTGAGKEYSRRIKFCRLASGKELGASTYSSDSERLKKRTVY